MKPYRQDIPLALYVHLPWCVKKCPYCDFNSHFLRGELPEQSYVEALLKDLEFAVSNKETRPLSSIFFGGGTPSLFSPQAIGQIIDAAQAKLGFTHDCEITLEANPGVGEHGQFAGYRAAGVNRISLGVQSLHDDSLKRLGRVHDAQAALSAIQAIKDAGFKTFNCDLMFGLPNQSVQMAADDVKDIIEQAPSHISYYQLTFEPGTAFFYKKPKRADMDTIADIYEQGAGLLQTAGYIQYEVSAWGQKSHFCQHNINYWAFGDYLAIGAGGHSKLTQGDGQIQRQSRQTGPNAFTRTAGTAESIANTRILSRDDLIFEFLLNGLRLRHGVTKAEFETRCGLPWSDLQKHLSWAIKAELLVMDDKRLRSSDQGWYYLDDILSAVLPQERSHA